MNNKKYSIAKTGSFSEFTDADPSNILETRKPVPLLKTVSTNNLDQQTDDFVEFLRQNNIEETGFVEKNEVEFYQKTQSAYSRQKMIENIKQRMSDFEEQKNNFLNSLFEQIPNKNQSFGEINRKLFAFYILKNYFNHENQPEENSQPHLQQKYDVAEAELNTFLKPLKCKICTSFIPIWLFLEHSNNCFAFYVSNVTCRYLSVPPISKHCKRNNNFFFVWRTIAMSNCLSFSSTIQSKISLHK